LSVVRLHSKKGDSFGDGAKPSTSIASVGQTTAHWPQPMQRAASAWIDLSVNEIALVGQWS
jgi:hypothetical protein